MEQNKKDIIKLIHLYQANECLWDIKSKLYRRTDIKNNVYRKIAVEMGMDDETVKKKIKSIRSTYTAERKRVHQSMKSGAGTDDIRESRLFYYNEMSFLDPCIVYREGSNNFHEMPKDNELSEENTDSMTMTEQLSHFDNHSFDVQNYLEEDHDLSLADADASTPIKKPNKKRKESSSSTQENSPNFDDALNKFISAVNSDSCTAEKDEFELFGQSIASQLRKLPERDAIQFMGRIQQQLTETRINIMSSTDSITTPLISSPLCHSLPSTSSSSQTSSSLPQSFSPQPSYNQISLSQPIKLNPYQTFKIIKKISAPNQSLRPSNLIKIAMQHSNIKNEYPKAN